jgi:antitoxin MazE
MAEAVRLVEGATVKLEIEGGSIRVTPTRKRFRLSELLQGEAVGKEFDWGKPTGQEQW